MNMLENYEELIAWNERFASFNDAVLRSWTLDFSSLIPVLEVVLETKDQASPSGWSLVKIRAVGLASVSFSDSPKASYQVLSNGLHTLREEGLVALEFGDCIDAPETLSELMASPCHVVAEKLEWEAQPVSQ